MIAKFFNIVIRILIKKATDYCHFLQDKEITDKNKETSSIHGLGAPVGCKGQEISVGNFDFFPQISAQASKKVLN